MRRSYASRSTVLEPRLPDPVKWAGGGFVLILMVWFVVYGLLLPLAEVMQRLMAALA